MKKTLMLLIIAFLLSACCASAVAESADEALSISVDGMSLDSLIELRNIINNRIVELSRDEYIASLQPATESDMTLESIFEDEAMALCVRDMLGKFSIKQTVTQAELDSITSIAVFSSKNYGTFTSLKGIGHLRNLNSLGLYNGCCSGIRELPDDFFTLAALTKVDLYRSSLTTIPDEIGQLINLKYLNIGKTGITVLPDSIGNLINLVSLDVSYTGLATLPMTIANCTSLTSLDISHTAITVLPDAVYSLNLSSINMAGLPIK